MEFKHIEYFIKVSQYKSMSQAAEALYILQQALSKCMQNLESELSCKLFHRTSKGSVLTEEGKYLYEKFLPIVQGFHDAEFDAIEKLSGQKKKITIANSPMIFGLLFPNLLYEFRDIFPNFELELLERLKWRL